MDDDWTAFIYMHGPDSASNTRYYLRDKPVTDEKGLVLLRRVPHVSLERLDAIGKLTNRYHGERRVFEKQLDALLKES